MSRKAPSERRKLGKNNKVRDVARLEDIPNIGPAIATDLRQLGIKSPAELPGRDPYALYDDLCRITGKRHDPCLLDTFIAAVRFMEGGPKKPWWGYTAERKREMAARSGGEKTCGRRFTDVMSRHNTARGPDTTRSEVQT